jgi:transcriptional regulator of met regulon
VNELLNLGLLSETAGKLKKAEDKLRITSSKPNPLIRKFHEEMLLRSVDLLRHSTTEEDLRRRLISGITITADPTKVQEAKRKLNDFLYELANELLSEPGSEVYHLAAQLFPLTK